jgi:hypothetical protein
VRAGCIASESIIAISVEEVDTRSEGEVMRTHLHRRLAALLASAAIALVIVPAHTASSTLADRTCPFGTNWDNAIHACR